MFEPNVQRILDRLSADDLVVDIGGWARPFNRADHVIDHEPHATRGFYGTAQGGAVERFREETWIKRDICSHEPFPFADKELDFAICSHTLEDIRDPLWVCSEMMRIAKAGYIEVPSRLAETCRGVEPGQVGWSHHRWLIDIEGSHVRFTMKYHKIHSHWSYSFPRRFLQRLSEEQTVQWLFWEGSFTIEETLLQGVGAIEDDLRAFVARHHPYPRGLLAADRLLRTAVSLPRRAWARAWRQNRARFHSRTEPRSRNRE